MRINDKRTSRKQSLPTLAAGNTELKINAGKEFPDALEKQYLREEKEDFEKLLKKLEDIGKKLADSFSIYELKNYKDTLRDFLQKTKGQVYRLKEETANTRQGKIKIMHLIQKIDAELEELSNIVLSRQKNQVKLLEKMDQIRGLLVDLYS